MCKRNSSAKALRKRFHYSTPAVKALYPTALQLLCRHPDAFAFAATPTGHRINMIRSTRLPRPEQDGWLCAHGPEPPYTTPPEDVCVPQHDCNSRAALCSHLQQAWGPRHATATWTNHQMHHIVGAGSRQHCCTVYSYLSCQLCKCTVSLALPVPAPARLHNTAVTGPPATRVSGVVSSCNPSTCQTPCSCDQAP